MALQQLDFLFPFVVFAYGSVITATLNLPILHRIAKQNGYEEQWGRMQAHQSLAVCCVLIGGLWSLQNLWF